MSGKDGPRDLDGNVYKENWAGKFELTGETDVRLFGQPNLKPGGIFAGPERATDDAGRELSGYEGTPLYRSPSADRPSSTGGSSSFEDTAATIGVMAILAAIVAAAVAALWMLRFVAARFMESARSDREAGRLSLTTLGNGTPLAWLTAWLVASVSGPRGSGALPALLWFVQDILFLATFVIAVTWAPVRTGELARPTIRDRHLVPTFWRWAIGAAISLSLTVGLFGQISRTTLDPAATVLVALVVLGIGVVQIAGLAWGWSGRPDWFTPYWVRVRAQLGDAPRHLRHGGALDVASTSLGSTESEPAPTTEAATPSVIGQQ